MILFTELHLEHAPTAEALAAALAATFTLDSSDLADAARRVAPELTPGPGPFGARLTLVVEPALAAATSPERVARELSRRLATRLIQDDGGPDPYRAALFTPEGDRIAIDLDVAALDAREEARPATRDPRALADALAHLRTFIRDARQPDGPDGGRGLGPAVLAAGDALTRLVLHAVPPLDDAARAALVAAERRVRTQWPGPDVDPTPALQAALRAADLLIDA